MRDFAGTKVLLVTLFLGLGCTSAPLTLPGPILGVGDNAATRNAILDGMAVRGWVVEKEEGTSILAKIDQRSHVAKVWIDYSSNQIQFRYGGSKGLDCHRHGESCSSIHRSYNKWVRNLSLDISRQVTARRAREVPAGAG